MNCAREETACLLWMGFVSHESDEVSEGSYNMDTADLADALSKSLWKWKYKLHFTGIY